MAEIKAPQSFPLFFYSSYWKGDVKDTINDHIVYKNSCNNKHLLSIKTNNSDKFNNLAEVYCKVNYILSENATEYIVDCIDEVNLS